MGLASGILLNYALSEVCDPKQDRSVETRMLFHLHQSMTPWPGNLKTVWSSRTVNQTRTKVMTIRGQSAIPTMRQRGGLRQHMTWTTCKALPLTKQLLLRLQQSKRWPQMRHPAHHMNAQIMTMTAQLLRCTSLQKLIQALVPVPEATCLCSIGLAVI